MAFIVSMDSGLFILSIDLGTTTLKAALIECNQYKTIEQYSEPMNGSVILNTDGRDEQDVVQILFTLNVLLEKFSIEKREKVIGISVTGQMHGVTLWNSNHDTSKLLMSQRPSPLTTSSCISSLVTWRDGRCTDIFLKSLPKALKPVSTGYGCCTLFWFQRFNESLLEQFNRAGTIMDLVVCLLCGVNSVPMSTQNANSWGYFDMTNNNWEIETYAD